MEFADLKNDVAFKKVFGNEKKTIIIISFLNAILDLKGDKRIKEVEILNPYQLSDFRDFKTTIIDVKAKDKRDNIYIVEMQLTNPEGLDRRLQFYASRAYSSQLKKGENYTVVNPLYTIGIFNFKFSQNPYYISRHLFLDADTQEHLLTDIQFYFVELPKFQKKFSDIQTLADKWIYFIKHSPEMQKIPENIGDEGLAEAYEDANQYTWSPKERELYENAEKAYFDEINKKAREKRLLKELENMEKEVQEKEKEVQEKEKEVQEKEKEVQEKEKEVQEKEKEVQEKEKEVQEKEKEVQEAKQKAENATKEANLKTAKNLKDKGVEIDIIITGTGLSREEIENL